MRGIDYTDGTEKGEDEAMTGENKLYHIGFHKDLSVWFLYLSAGLDDDGKPLTYATPLTSTEVLLYTQGLTARLERSLRSRGIPLPEKPTESGGRLRRFLRKLRRKLTGGRRE